MEDIVKWAMKDPTLDNGYVYPGCYNESSAAGKLSVTVYFFCWSEGKDHNERDVNYGRGMPWRYEISLKKTIFPGTKKC